MQDHHIYAQLRLSEQSALYYPVMAESFINLYSAIYVLMYFTTLLTLSLNYRGA